MNDITPKKFSNALSNANLDAVFHCEDCNDFVTNFRSLYCKCFAHKTRRKPRKARNRWITNDSLKAIKNRKPFTGFFENLKC